MIDAVTRLLIPGATYDADGALAARRRRRSTRSSIDLLTHPYFAAEPPKSTGRELFDRAYVESLVAGCREANPAPPPTTSLPRRPPSPRDHR